MAINTSDDTPGARRSGTLVAWLKTSIRAALRVFDGRCEKRRSRMALCALTNDELEDIGVSRAEARKETARSAFWG
jgi:uncharacterized protein YjiS (DUF1127 family)